MTEETKNTLKRRRYVERKKKPIVKTMLCDAKKKIIITSCFFTNKHVFKWNTFYGAKNKHWLHGLGKECVHGVYSYGAFYLKVLWYSICPVIPKHTLIGHVSDK